MSGSVLGSILILLGFCSLVVVSSISIVAVFMTIPFLTSSMNSISESESGASISTPPCLASGSSTGSSGSITGAATSFTIGSSVWASVTACSVSMAFSGMVISASCSSLSSSLYGSLFGSSVSGSGSETISSFIIL